MLGWLAAERESPGSKGRKAKWRVWCGGSVGMHPSSPSIHPSLILGSKVVLNGRGYNGWKTGGLGRAWASKGTDEMARNVPEEYPWAGVYASRQDPGHQRG